MNRIDQTFQDLRKRKKKAFIAYVTAGFPNLSITEKLILNLEKAGVDIIEIGVPFSDPLADGPTIQTSSQKALDGKITLEKIFGLAKKIRKQSQIPLAFMTYYNPVFHYGEERFIKKCKDVGVDGMIIPDLPPEEARNIIRYARKHNVATVFFLSPTTTAKRIPGIAKASTGFIYFVSLTGVTGARQQLSPDIKSKVRIAKRFTKKPICVGFGISTPQHVQMISKFADGVIVGSVIIKEIQKSKKDIVHRVVRLVQQLKKGIQ